MTLVLCPKSGDVQEINRNGLILSTAGVAILLVGKCIIGRAHAFLVGSQTSSSELYGQSRESFIGDEISQWRMVILSFFLVLNLG